MSIEYLGLSSINGPLIVLEGVQDAFYDEIVEFVVDGTERKIGRIVEIYEDKAVIQVFEGSENMSLKNTHTQLYPHRNFRDRRTDNSDSWTEASDFLRKWTSARSACCTDCKTGFSWKRF